MDIPNEMPIIYTSQILIPDYSLKIKLSVKNETNLLKYLTQNIEPRLKIGIIPKIDFEKVKDVIGTVGQVRSVIQIDSNPQDFYILVLGICRFKLDGNVSEEPLKIHKIIPIKNLLQLVGDEKEKSELKAEFQKVVRDLACLKTGTFIDFPDFKINLLLKILPIDQSVDYCLRNIIQLTPDYTYKVLRATSLNDRLKLVIDWIKQETINGINKNSKYEKTGLIPRNSAIIDLPGGNDVRMEHLSSELEELLTSIKNSNMPSQVYDSIMKEFNRLQKMSTHNHEYSIVLHHVSYVVNLPWNKSSNETLDLGKARSVLKLSHYGMDEVKNRILQFIAVRILNPKLRGPILCFIGPPGVGKTTIAKGIANSLNRNFIRVSVGGINKVSDIKGHRKTFIGSMPGCIIDAVNRSQTNNPVILLDEIDKMCKDSTGDPAAALLEVLDPEQNGSFVDSFVSYPFDISQVMFVTTANNAKNIPWTLRDRMEMIVLEGYTYEEKMEIAENYLIPKVLKEHKMNEVQITFHENAISDIIKKYTYETGVRELQRKIEAICHYIAVEIVENGDKEMKNYVITPKSVLNILGIEKYDRKNILVEQCSNRVGVAIGLSWTPFGGKVQVIETSRMYSRNGLVLTGLAGQTLRESVQIALNWIQSFAKKNVLNMNNFCVHVHLPEGAFKKDGPSAGITILCALISLFWKTPLRPMIAMTGEISLKGFILPVGGVKEKVLAAYNSGIKTIIIPELNLKDTISLPQHIVEDLKIIPVKHVKEVLDTTIPGGLKFLQRPISDILPKSKF